MANIKPDPLYNIPADLFKHGIEVFETSENFINWLQKKNFFFDMKAPIEFMRTSSGIKFIEDRLTGIQYGDNA